jgi:hypothetical protein
VWQYAGGCRQGGHIEKICDDVNVGRGCRELQLDRDAGYE